MRKAIFYLPALVHTTATVCLNLMSGALIPLWHLWNILFWLSGWLMRKGKVWGFIPGLLPGGMILLMKSGDPFGIEHFTALGWTAFYLACGLLIWRKQKGRKK